MLEDDTIQNQKKIHKSTLVVPGSILYYCCFIFGIHFGKTDDERSNEDACVCVRASGLFVSRRRMGAQFELEI